MFEVLRVKMRVIRGLWLEICTWETMFKSCTISINLYEALISGSYTLKSFSRLDEIIRFDRGCARNSFLGQCTKVRNVCVIDSDILV